MIDHLREEFAELDKKLEELKGSEGYEVKAFLAEKDYLEKAKKILVEAHKFDPDDE